MGRPREFDEEKALQAAAECFWTRGFEATSVRDLTGSMGIAGPSLYNAYGGKRGLFEAALHHYCAGSMRARIARLDATVSGVAAIEAFFADVIAKSGEASGQKGCFLVNSALEVAPHDETLGQIIRDYFDEIRAFFQRHIEAAQDCGGTPTALDAGLHSVHLLSVLIGIRGLARCYPDPNFLEAAAAPALARLRASTHR